MNSDITDFDLEMFNRLLDRITDKHLLNYTRLLKDLREDNAFVEERIALQYREAVISYMENLY